MLTNDVLVVTPAGSYRTECPRVPLTRLAPPAERIPKNLRSPRGPVWWAERYGRKIWLRAYAVVSNSSVELPDRYRSRRLLWDAALGTPERLTWPGTFDHTSAEVSAILKRYALPLSVDCWAVQIPLGLQVEFECRRRALPENAWNFEMARNLVWRSPRPFERSMRSAELSGQIEAARAFVRNNLARSELVSLSGEDPYEVTAAILAGYSEMPIGRSAAEAKPVVPPVSPSDFEFLPIGPDDIARLSGAWPAPDLLSAPEDRERADLRHQLILNQLAKLLVTQGFALSYNRFVDLRAQRDYLDLFIEVKSADDSNFSRQARLAVGQLLEYRCRHEKTNSGKPIRLVAVIERVSSDSSTRFVREFLAGLGIHLIVWNQDAGEITGLEGGLDTLLAVPSPRSFSPGLD